MGFLFCCVFVTSSSFFFFLLFFSLFFFFFFLFFLGIVSFGVGFVLLLCVCGFVCVLYKVRTRACVCARVCVFSVFFLCFNFKKGMKERLNYIDYIDNYK